MKKIIALLAAVLVASTLTACGEKTYQAKGSITVLGNVAVNGNEPCRSLSGYDDINEGAQVKVTVEGNTVALGKLEAGSPTEMGNYACKFNFALDDVPSGKNFYSVEISHRGALEYSEDDLTAGIELSIGK